MKVVYSEECLLHDPPYEVTRGKVQAYVESPARLKSIKQFIDSQPDDFSVISPQDYSLAPILDVHDDDFVKFLSTIYDDWVAAGLPSAAAIGETFAHMSTLSKIDPAIYKMNAQLTPSARVGLYTLDMSVSYMKDTWRAAYASVQVALTAAHTLLKSQSSSIYALCRPPGHHASCNLAAGYCFINNVAVVTRFLQNYSVEEMDAMAKTFNSQSIINVASILESGSSKKNSENHALQKKKKIMIVDIDYHHGNGTQDIFYDDPSILYISLHGHPDYPFFTGSAEERGRGQGEGYNINIPLNPATTDDAVYLDHLTRVLQSETAVNFNADTVIVSMGLDTWWQDPIAGMKGLKDEETYTKMGRLFKTAPSCQGRPILFVQEGGYTVDMLGKLAGNILQGYIR